MPIEGKDAVLVIKAVAEELGYNIIGDLAIDWSSISEYRKILRINIFQ